jgi:hypothetical protein
MDTGQACIQARADAAAFPPAETEKPEPAVLGLPAGFRRGDEEKVKPAASD